MRRHKKQQTEMTPNVCTGLFRSISSIPIKSTVGRTLTTEEEQSNRWMEHFEGVLKRADLMR